MTKNTVFLSKSLQEIDLEAESIVSSHLQNLDRISNDIKLLEEKLLTSAIPFNFIYVFKTESELNKNENATEYENICFYKVVTEHIDSCLSWEKDQNGDFRLRYKVYKTIDEHDEIHNYENDEIGERTTYLGTPFEFLAIPLIESKAHFRLEIEKELPHFYKAIISGLKSSMTENRIVEYSPNYNLPACFAFIESRTA